MRSGTIPYIFYKVFISQFERSLPDFCKTFPIDPMHKEETPLIPGADLPFVCKGRVGRRDPCRGKRIDDPLVEQYFQRVGISKPAEYSRPRFSYLNVMNDLISYCRNPSFRLSVDDKYWDRSYDFLSQEFLPYTLGSVVVDVASVYDDLDKSTSPGFPWNRKFHDKNSYVEQDSVLKEYCSKWSENLSTDSSCFWNVFPKDEILPIGKVKSERIRTISGSPLEHGLALGSLSISFNENLYRSTLQHSCAVGHSEYRGGRHRIISKLKRPGWTCFEADLSSQDRTTKNEFYMGLVKLRSSSFDNGDAHLSRLSILYALMLFSYLVDPQGYVWLTLGGNKSGQCNTLVDNTLNLFRAFAYAWLELAPEGYKDYSSFKENVILVLFGDDSLWSVSPFGAHFFTGHRVAVVFRTLGYFLTVPADLPKQPEELTFLSARSVLIRGFWLPVRDFEKLKASLAYLGSKNDSGLILLDRIVGLRNSYWPEPRCNQLCKDLFVFVREYTVCMSSDPVRQIILNSFKSDDELLRLYSGLES